VKLLERVVAASSNPGDLVADFFCGSGTTGVAAQRQGRRFLLVDDNPDAIRIARERLGLGTVPAAL
jgi:site-specific DNA-methyltransferase (adenine-specific)